MSSNKKKEDGSKIDFGKLFTEFSNEFKLAFVQRGGNAGKNVQRESNLIWNEAKTRFGKDSIARKKYIEQYIASYKIERTQNKTKGVMKFISCYKKAQDKLDSGIDHNGSSTKSVRINDSQVPESESLPEESKMLDRMTSCAEKSVEPALIQQGSNNNIRDVLDTLVPGGTKRSYSTPAQNKLKEEVEFFEKRLTAQIVARNANLGGDTSQTDIEETKKDLASAKRALDTVQKNAMHQMNFRKRQRMIRSANAPESPNDTIAPTQNRVGRPSLESVHPNILELLIQFACFGAAAHGRRHTEEFRSCKTLTELQEKLNSVLGMKISRSAVYLRLLPRRSNTLEGKRHVTTVPVKLCKAQNSEHKSHPDALFCTSSIRYVESLASVLGPQQVAFISQDDKARVALGVTAAQKQSPILMHTEYRVTLPDHDFVVAERHKLIPSVYAGIEIQSNAFGKPEAVTYSGPTYVAIRNGKHDSSTAASHAADFEHLLEIPEFDNIMKYQNEIKPVIAVTSDGGPDENPRYPGVIICYIELFFKMKKKVDCIIVVTNAPGRSCFNRVERRMAPLSRQLSGLILDHKHYGNHLDSSGRTVDEELERQNFQKAGETLAEIWSEMNIDNYPVVAEFVPPKPQSSHAERKIDEQWYADHVRESQYLLQISKCKNVECCGELRSDLRSILPDGFLPAPIKVKQADGKLKIASFDDASPGAKFLPLFQRLALDGMIHREIHDFKFIPYDYFCPTVRSQIDGRVCCSCGAYFASKKAQALHKKSLNHKIRPDEKSKKKKRMMKVEAQRNGEALCQRCPRKHCSRSSCKLQGAQRGSCYIQGAPA